MNTFDDDLMEMTREQLMAEILKLRQGIRKHRDSSGHDLCWFHPELWSLLPEKVAHTPAVPEWHEFMAGCIKFRKSLDDGLPNAPRTKEKFEEK